ncbi:MAG TPA: C1 family peptidase [Opitutaceae bacterium]
MRLAIAALALAFAIPASAEAPKEFAELRIKETVYRNVRVVSRNPASITVRHAGGIAQIQFKDMSPELQAQFSFVPEDVAAFEDQVRRQAEEAAARQAREREARAAAAASKTAVAVIDSIAQSFATLPEIRSVDMRPRLRELELFVKDQGRAPSCAVYAVVSAMELQNFEATGRPEKLSEAYLVWATHQIAGSRARVVLDEDGTGVIDDAGFSLLEVFQAVGKFGIPTHEALERHLGGQGGAIEMPPELIQEALVRRGVVAYQVPGRDNAEVARNILHVLNHGRPVILALRWPNANASQGGLLSSQEPIAGYAHAVTIVGYTSATGRPEDLRFIFKNSWGPKWGAYGYGFADMNYMSKNLLGAAFMDISVALQPRN